MLIILAGIVLPKLVFRMLNFVAALIATFIILVGSLIQYTPGYGYGGLLMLTLPFSPIILLVLWLVYSSIEAIKTVIGSRRTNQTQTGS